jgi:UDP-glucose 4-epimerase
MNYIVTGGAGFIGSNLVEQLITNGNTVHIIDNLTSGDIRNLTTTYSKVTFSPKFEEKTPEKCDGIYHLGFPSSSPMYKKDPKLVASALHDTIQVFEYASTKKIPVVYASTSSLYNGNPTPWSETLTVKITDYYTETRYYVERLAELYHNLKNLNTFGLRLFSVYGENEKYKGQYANLVSQFIWDMVADKSPLIYFDGEQKRDFIHQSDVVNAFIKAMELLDPKKSICDVVNVGTGKNYSLNELVKMINKGIGSQLKPTYENPNLKNYVQDTLADTTKMHKLIGKHKIDLPKGLEKVIQATKK